MKKLHLDEMAKETDRVMLKDSFLLYRDSYPLGKENAQLGRQMCVKFNGYGYPLPSALLNGEEAFHR
jgi:hypothetical protein